MVKSYDETMEFPRDISYQLSCIAQRMLFNDYLLYIDKTIFIIKNNIT